MLLMLLIGWIVVLPALVVAGLYVGSRVLGRRRAAMNGFEELFSQEPGLDAALHHQYPPVTPSMIIGRVEPERPAEILQPSSVDAA